MALCESLGTPKSPGFLFSFCLVSLFLFFSGSLGLLFAAFGFLASSLPGCGSTHSSKRKHFTIAAIVTGSNGSRNKSKNKNSLRGLDSQQG